VRMRGPVEVVTPEEADAYFGSRPKGSQIASSASDQSRVLDSKLTLLNRVSHLATTIDDGPVPRPPHWSGFRIVPTSIEFWKDGEFRLHDRVRFERDGGGWVSNRLYP
jgi:pyridoxamine 5'-phosphate oxidase